MQKVLKSLPGGIVVATMNRDNAVEVRLAHSTIKEYLISGVEHLKTVASSTGLTATCILRELVPHIICTAAT
jgi:hypothetical protein